MSHSLIKPYTNKRGVTHMAHYAGTKYIGPVSKLGDEPIVLTPPVVRAQVVTEIPIAVRVEDEDELIVSEDESVVSDDESVDDESVVSEDEVVVSDDEDDEFDETIYKSYISTKTYDEKMDMYWDMMDDETKTNERRIILGMVM